MRERLQKVLAAAGISSRRAAEEMIARGEVTVNGHIAHLGESADPDADIILVRGRPLAGAEENVYVALNKPRGYVTSLRSTHGERTVDELVSLPQRVFPVGRLDKETTGLLLLSNDGEWANHVTHPRFGIEKEYDVLVEGRPSPATLERLRQGIVLPDGQRTAPAEVRLARQLRGATRLLITVTEGKKRQIRLMLQAVHHPVISMRRIRIGPVELGSLREGSWRLLTPREVESLRHAGRQLPAPGGTRPGPADRH